MAAAGTACCRHKSAEGRVRCICDAALPFTDHRLASEMHALTSPLQPAVTTHSHQDCCFLCEPRHAREWNLSRTERPRQGRGSSAVTKVWCGRSMEALSVAHGADLRRHSTSASLARPPSAACGRLSPWTSRASSTRTYLWRRVAIRSRRRRERTWLDAAVAGWVSDDNACPLATVLVHDRSKLKQYVTSRHVGPRVFVRRGPQPLCRALRAGCETVRRPVSRAGGVHTPGSRSSDSRNANIARRKLQSLLEAGSRFKTLLLLILRVDLVLTQSLFLARLELLLTFLSQCLHW